MPNTELKSTSNAKTGFKNDFLILEPWAKAALHLHTPVERAAFWDAIAKYALYAEEPGKNDTIGWFAYAMAARVIDNHKAKIKAGSKGGKARQTASKRQADGKQTPSTSQADGKQTPSTSQADGKQTAS